MSETSQFTQMDTRVPATRRRAVRIAFFGFYGRRNFGDDLFGYVLQRMAERAGGVQPMLVGAPVQPELSAAWRWSSFSRYFGHGGLIGTIARFATYCAAMVRADVAAFGGGSLFGAHASLAFARLIVFGGALLRKPVAALGVSLGPFEDSGRRRQFLDLAARLDALAVRDAASLKELRDSVVRHPAVLLGDLAFALPALYRPSCVGESRTLIVAVHLIGYVEHAVAILRDADRSGRFDRVRFVALDDDSARVADAIRQRYTPQTMQFDDVRFADSIESIIDVLASASCIVTSKLHGAISGHVYGVPVLLFCYQRKCADFLDDRRLPGPRDPMPAPDDCVAAVHALMGASSDGVGEACYRRAERYRRVFTGFIRTVAGLND
ncbi:polysaccharide pyruvyl transferase family protein [Burkholderia sp. AU6039]|uniref:polysaccharide pyruvyl transferase family protein n=1 Tax=Burkholderia sp. AU6039 TaxID=2015344 RepID=UPI0015C636F8|nr:polysaccharide pyruvyl transferase family protein [Burkholderia sp. AU6039]